MASYYTFDLEESQCWVELDAELFADFADAERDHEERRQRQHAEGAQRFAEALAKRCGCTIEELNR